MEHIGIDLGSKESKPQRLQQDTTFTVGATLTVRQPATRTCLANRSVHRPSDMCLDELVREVANGPAYPLSG